MRKPILVFDIAETILDLGSLALVFEQIFDDPTVLRTWFDEVVIYSEALTITGSYVDAGKVGGAVLQMLAHTRSRTISDAQLAVFKNAVSTMPAHADVQTGLERLQAAGFRMVTLSNNPTATCETQLKNAGIRRFFDHVFSVDDAVRRYKPAQETYASVASTLNLQPSDMWLITCHAFDAMGAIAAGWHAGLILRPGNAPFALGTQPEWVGPDLDVLSKALINQFAGA